MKLSITDTLLLLVILSLFSQLTNTNDTINTNQSVTDNQTLVSSGVRFELGFFSPGNSKNWYFGIWYKNITPKTVVWVANREIPLKSSASGVFKINATGFLVILNETNNIIWSSKNSGPAQNLFAQLLDSGNLVLREVNDDNPQNYLWQSFDYPTDTILAGMDFLVSSSILSSWKTDEDPAPGYFTVYVDPAGYPQGFIKRGAETVNRLGPWNGLLFSGSPDVRGDATFTLGLYKNRGGALYYREEAVDSSVISRITLNPSGIVQRWTWVDRTQAWVCSLNFPEDNCDSYRLCGAYGSCSMGNFPVCGCLDTFVPKDPERWARSDWSNGCARRTEFNCTVGDGFFKYTGIKLPDARNSWHDERLTLEECRVECLKNCCCMAYTNLNISNGGSGCLIYFGELVDIKVISSGGQSLYIRMAPSELGSSSERKKILIVSSTLIGVAVLGLSLLLYIWKRKKNDTTGRKIWRQDEMHNKDLELPLFPLSTISKATDNFALRNKLGEGGYGPVYKGTLEEGQDIAVKRLSKTSMQGFGEFKNEALCIAKHQHRNLLKLLGCCIEGEEKMLMHEYLPNKSLDLILFDEKKRMLLDWPKRFSIVNGIARGLMYLHQDSRLRIIHRDLKASNVLLDSEMNPKISDFGLAKRFKGNETEDTTSRVVGTYGYMSPEYAVHGQFSVKSDVFSFGVLVLEIVSGKRNSSFSHGDRHLNLLGYAWTLYNEGRAIEFIDTYVQDSASLGEVLRLIHVGLLCAQQFPDDRPNMSSVVSMLSNEVVLPQGTLEEGQDIAVKRLSKTSMQGLDEFKNEAICIAKHQHRNLVKLLGCCIQGEEKMLIYEYMPNKSLDLILFDEKKRVFLDWPKRFSIVHGIARGLMYLHQDSQLRIIHRDLKASNVLLDSEMNPKISDFGLAKRFKGNETEDKTSQVVGTYGYMSPEYAVRGQFSVKSDVLSFGVLVLEIVSGKRNSSFSHGDRHLTLLGHAWTLYKEGKSIELVDTYVHDSASLGEAPRLIHVGLLCVQQYPDDRPTTSSVVSILSNEVVLPQHPNEPGFFTESHTLASSSTGPINTASSTNEVTITMPQGR